MRKLLVRWLSKIAFKASRRAYKAFSKAQWVNISSEPDSRNGGLYICQEPGYNFLKIFWCN